MTERGVTITIPAGPAYSISPNSRKHWRVKHRESQELKGVAMYSGLHLQNYTTTSVPPTTQVHGPVNLHWTIHLAKGRKPMDRDNATATLKPAMDGLVLARTIDGDTQDIVRAITVDQVKWADHKGDPKIVVRIEPAA